MDVKLLHKENGHSWGAFIPALIPRDTMVKMSIEQLDLDPDGIDKEDIDYKRIVTKQTEDGTEYHEISEDEGIYSTVWSSDE